MKHRLFTFIVKHLFNTITADDVIFRNEKGQMVLGKRVLTQEETLKVIEEAQYFRDSIIWEVMRRNIQAHVNVKALAKATTPNDILGSKMALWILQLIDEKLTELGAGEFRG